LLVELLSDQTEVMSGVRPTTSEVLSFLRGLVTSSPARQVDTPKVAPARPGVAPTVNAQPVANSAHATTLSGNKGENPATRGPVTYRILEQGRSARNAKEAFVEVLRGIVGLYPQRIEAIAVAARGRTRNHIARSVEQIYPARPDLAISNTAEIHDGWLVGLNIANRDKVRIIRAACEATGLRFGSDVQFELPNT
jgi:hypothetical protein